MIPDYLYQTIYLILVTIISVIVFFQYYNRNGLVTTTYNISSNIICVLIIILFVLYIGLRPLSGRYFGDMPVYVDWYGSYEGIIFQFDKYTDNRLFDNIIAWWGSEHLGYTSFFLFIAAIYFGAAYLGIRKLFPNNTLAAYLVFLAAFSTFSYATNGIKAGAAASLSFLPWVVVRT